jgi:hypothetical protein
MAGRERKFKEKWEKGSLRRKEIGIERKDGKR